MPRAAWPSTGWAACRRRPGGGRAAGRADGERRRVDLHLYEPRRGRPIHYGSVLDPYPFAVEAVGGRGTIAGTDVRCESPEWAVRWRTDDPPRPNDLHDVPLLCAKFGIPRPAGF